MIVRTLIATWVLVFASGAWAEAGDAVAKSMARAKAEAKRWQQDAVLVKITANTGADGLYNSKRYGTNPIFTPQLIFDFFSPSTNQGRRVYAAAEVDNVLGLTLLTISDMPSLPDKFIDLPTALRPVRKTTQFMPEIQAELQVYKTGPEELRTLWRILSLDSTQAKMWKGHIYVDAISGEITGAPFVKEAFAQLNAARERDLIDPVRALSERYPVRSTSSSQDPLNAWFPIRPSAFPKGDILVDELDARPELFNGLRVNQRAEALVLSLRQMAAEKRSDADMRNAIDKLARWTHKVDELRKAHAIGGVAALEAAIKKEPEDILLMKRLAEVYVDEVERELYEMTPPSKAAKFKLAPFTSTWPNGAKSDAFPKAAAMVQKALERDPSDAEVLMLAALLYRRQADPTQLIGVTADVMHPANEAEALSKTRISARALSHPPARLLLAETAATKTGSAAALANFYLIQEDVRPSELRGRSYDLRNPRPELRYVEPDPDLVLPLESQDDPLNQPHLEIQTPPPTGLAAAQADAIDRIAQRIEQANAVEIEKLIGQYVRHEPLTVTLCRFLLEAGHRSLARTALLIDPGDFHFYAVLAEARDGRPEQKKAAAFVELRLLKNSESDFIALYDEVIRHQFDPLIAYAVALQAVRTNPLRPEAHHRLGDAIYAVRDVLPDALRHGLNTRNVEYHLAAWMLDHPDEWRAERKDSKDTFITAMAKAQTGRADFLKLLGRGQEARAAYQKALDLVPNFEPARAGLAQPSR